MNGYNIKIREEKKQLLEKILKRNYITLEAIKSDFCGIDLSEKRGKNQGWIADLRWLRRMKIAAVRADKIMDYFRCYNKSLHYWKMEDNEAPD